MQRIQKRRAGQRQTQNALIGLLSAVSMTRIGLTQLLTSAGAPRGGFLPRVCCRGCASTALCGCSCATRTRGR